MSGVLQELCRRQPCHSPADDGHVAWRLAGRKPLLHDVEKLAVVAVLQAVKQGVPQDPADGEHHHADQSQRN